MNNIEKALFLKMRQYQYGQDEESETLATYGKMSQNEKDQYSKLSSELHRIWNYINSQPVLNVRPDDGITTVCRYHEKVTPVNEVILKVVNDFNFTLKDSVTKKQKEAIIAILGEDYFNTNYGNKPIIEDLD